MQSVIAGGGARSGAAPAQVILPATRPQLTALASDARFLTVFANRRFGKTTWAKLRLLKKFGTPPPVSPGLAWWVGPTYRQVKKPFLSLVRTLRQLNLLKGKPSLSEMVLETVTGWTLEARSAQEPDNLRGDGLLDVTVDEAARVSDIAWDDCLRPALADHGGEACAISSAAGRRGWAYKMYQLGLAKEPGYDAFHFTAYDAAFIAPAELESARRTMSKRAFRQEFLTEFLAGEGVVFEDVGTRPRRDGVYGEPEGIGSDWAKKKDRTWFFSIGARSGVIRDWVLIPQRLPYPKQVELLVAFRKRRLAAGAAATFLVHDQTGVGEAIDDQLRLANVGKFEGVVLTNQSKAELVEETIVDLESGQLSLPQGFELSPHGAMALEELKNFTLTVLPTGRITYGAPEGLHDDAVIAILMANRARRCLARVEPALQLNVSDFEQSLAAAWGLASMSPSRIAPRNPESAIVQVTRTIARPVQPLMRRVS